MVTNRFTLGNKVSDSWFYLSHNVTNYIRAEEISGLNKYNGFGQVRTREKWAICTEDNA